MVGLAACAEPAAAQPKPHRTPALAPTQAAPKSAANLLRNAYFGDLHLHTSNSFDAALMTVTTPDDAYRYAKGAAIPRMGGLTIQLERPLDFLAVTDHADYLGVAQEMRRKGSPIYDLPLAKDFRSPDIATKTKTYFALLGDFATAKGRPELINESAKTCSDPSE